MSEIAIRVENLSKQYRIGAAQQRHDTLRDASLFAGLAVLLAVFASFSPSDRRRPAIAMAVLALVALAGVWLLASFGTRFDDRTMYDIAREALRKPVIFCGDLNVAHQEIDIARPKENRRSPGFSDEERESFTQLLGSGFTDTFRYHYPDKAAAYSWWSYRAGARQKNVGWRIDYFGVSTPFMKNVAAAEILPHVHGSDHCPVGITLG